MLQSNIDVEDIIKIAKEAGEIAMQFYEKKYSIEEKANKTPVTEADIAIHCFLMDKLSVYDCPILSEEGDDDFKKREDAECVWIIDPLDGTSDFIQKTGDFSILIALVQGDEPVLGVAYEPAKDTIYWAEKGAGAFKKECEDIKKIHVSGKSDFSDMTILLSRNHLLDSDTALCNKLKIEKQKKRGSTSKMCVIARGDAELYVNTSDKTAEWDTCAVNIILDEAGGKITNMNGEKLSYNTKDPVHHDGFVASNNARHSDVVKALGVNKCHESVYFYTLHKCASTFFSDFVLENINGLQHVDYAKRVYSGEVIEKSISFEKEGYIYGPIRLGAILASPGKVVLTDITTRHSFVEDKKVIFFIRDPRDIMISMYYSFGFSHTLSSVENIRKRQLRLREKIQKKTIDEYVLESVNKQVKIFEAIYELKKSCKNCTVLKYENLIDNFDDFSRELRKFVDIDDDVIERMYRETRPREEEDVSAHRRSGKVGGFRKKLNKKTIEELNEKFANILELFEYEP